MMYKTENANQFSSDFGLHFLQFVTFIDGNNDNFSKKNTFSVDS